MSPFEQFVRKQEIDRALQAAGWRVVSYARWSNGDRTAADAIEEYSTTAGRSGDPRAGASGGVVGIDPRVDPRADTQVCPNV